MPTGKVRKTVHWGGEKELGGERREPGQRAFIQAQVYTATEGEGAGGAFTHQLPGS